MDWANEKQRLSDECIQKSILLRMYRKVAWKQYWKWKEEVEVLKGIVKENNVEAEGLERRLEEDKKELEELDNSLRKGEENMDEWVNRLDLNIMMGRLDHKVEELHGMMNKLDEECRELCGMTNKQDEEWGELRMSMNRLDADIEELKQRMHRRDMTVEELKKILNNEERNEKLDQLHHWMNQFFVEEEEKLNQMADEKIGRLRKEREDPDELNELVDKLGELVDKVVNEKLFTLDELGELRKTPMELIEMANELSDTDTVDELDEKVEEPDQTVEEVECEGLDELNELADEFCELVDKAVKKKLFTRDELVELRETLVELIETANELNDTDTVDELDEKVEEPDQTVEVLTKNDEQIEAIKQLHMHPKDQKESCIDLHKMLLKSIWWLPILCLFAWLLLSYGTLLSSSLNDGR